MSFESGMSFGIAGYISPKKPTFELSRSMGSAAPGFPSSTCVAASAANSLPAGSLPAAAESLLKAGVPAAALARHGDLVNNPHLAAREFWDKHGAGVLPGLPWRSSFGRATGPAPGLGADSDHVLANVLRLPSERIAELRANGALG